MHAFIVKYIKNTTYCVRKNSIFSKKFLFFTILLNFIHSNKNDKAINCDESSPNKLENIAS
ncbi:MAG: hypothetical protein EAY66_07185 [Sphingobacteriales bacterium]|nr:MAG: hypothetical protein EAY66_07185 [Sphingobacteriales bacterium]